MGKSKVVQHSFENVVFSGIISVVLSLWVTPFMSIIFFVELTHHFDWCRLDVDI